MSNKIELQGQDFSALKGKSALILGGGSGSGLATALTLAKAGARVTVADIVPNLTIISQFQAQGLGIQYVKCDVTYWQQQSMAFKQAIHFAPNQTLDLVCCFAAVDRCQDLVEEAQQMEPRIDGEPLAPLLEEVEVNLKGVFDSTKLALHFFRVPDRTVATRRARPGTPSSASSITRSSVRSRSRSRSGSRPRSRPTSQPVSPVLAPPPASGSTDEATKAEEQADKQLEQQEDAFKDKQVPFTKCLVIVSGLSAYVDDGHSSFYSASSFALRGLFRSIRTKARQDLGVRVNLVAPWALRTPATEPLLKKLEENGLIEREDTRESLKNKDESEKAGEENTDKGTHAEGVSNGDADVIGNGSEVPIKEVTNAEVTTSDAGVDIAGSAPGTTTNGNPEHASSTVSAEQSQQSPTTPATASAAATAEADSQQVNRIEHQPEPASLTTQDEAEAEAEAEKEQAASAADDAKDSKDASTTAATQEDSSIINNDNTEATSSAVTDSGTTDVAEVQYKNMHFASLQDVADTVALLCADSSKSGRAIAVMPEGAFDLHDDHEGGYAGEQVKHLLNKRRDAGDMICKILNLTPDVLDDGGNNTTAITATIDTTATATTDTTATAPTATTTATTAATTTTTAILVPAADENVNGETR